MHRVKHCQSIVTTSLRPPCWLLAVAVASLSSWASGDPSTPISFNREIRPILAERCFRCHGHDEGAREGELRLDVREIAIEKAFTPGNSFASRLINRVTDDDLEHRMPPPETGDALSEREIDLLADWIDEGAEYEQHWSYTKLVRPELPTVQNTDWPANPIDRFILARLEAGGIAPSPDADVTTLARRLHFDLLGLPATPSDRDAYRQADHGAYVGRLLASPHYGERMAIGWLDLVRYADSTGYHGDEFWDMYPYRDYVIDAFNDNKPFDEFTIEQLAGDLLPGVKEENQIASAYNRLNQVTSESGTNVEEYLVKYASDRARTTASVWLGTTIGCAECHDHKFDPISMRDFYRFTAFFADIEDRGVYIPGQDYPPFLKLPTAAQKADMRRLQKERTDVTLLVSTVTPELARAQSRWEDGVRKDIGARDHDWTPLKVLDARAENETTLTVTSPGTVLASGAIPVFDDYIVTFATDLPRITGIRLEVLEHDTYLRNGRIGIGPLMYGLTEIELRKGERAIPIARAEADSEGHKFKASKAIDGIVKTRWSPQIVLAPGPHQIVASLEDPVEAGPDARFEVTLRFNSFPFNQIEYFRLTATSIDIPRLGPRDGIPPDVVEYVIKGPKRRSKVEDTRVTKHFLSNAAETESDRIRLLELVRAWRELLSSVAKIPITVSQEPRPVHVLNRGDWMDPSEETVVPGTLACLTGPKVRNRRLNRLDLARWLVSDTNPLTARVFVNRLWNQFFGNGLSNVLDDLGAQGEWPTHPELMDWLAVEFLESGWDVKHMVELLVTSHTYRQRSDPRLDLAEIDADNRLYARQHRARLGAELVRDNALVISGLLMPEVGGRSVFPYQPEGLYAHTNTQTFGNLIYKTDLNEHQYRRGLYTVWKRSFLHPSLRAFDAPSREECTAQRPESNTPLQALVLLNDPTYIETARAFAERIVEAGGSTAHAQVRWAFEQALLREPAAAEMEVLVALYSKHRAQYDADPGAARALLSIGIYPMPETDRITEVAAWTSVARTLLNLHETITRS